MIFTVNISFDRNGTQNQIAYRLYTLKVSASNRFFGQLAVVTHSSHAAETCGH